MKKNRKFIVGIAVIVLLAAIVLVSNILRRNQQLRDLKVVVAYGAYTAVPRDNQQEANGIDLSRTVDTLLSAETLRQQMLAETPTLLSVKVKEVDYQMVERLARKSPYVETAKATVNVMGDLVVKVVQRTPVVRLFTEKGEYYLSHDGHAMPLSPEGEADVLVGNGEVKERVPKEMLKLAVWLYDNPLYGNLFDQVNINAQGELLLVPKVGSHVVILGSKPEGLEEKMADLLVFYRKGMSQVGWNTYREINLKYNGQIICK